MNNKFLNFLLKEKLKDISYAVKEISSERDKLYTNKEEEYPYIDDMLQFFLELNVSQEDLFDAMGEKVFFSLANILVGRELQNDKNRENKINTFNPLFEHNLKFFKEAMKICLDEHIYIREEFKEKNTEIFKRIVDIGLNKGLFKHFKSVELQTQNENYKKILVDKKIFNAEYKLQDAINVLSKGNNETAGYFLMHSEKIYKELEGLNYEKLDNLEKLLIKITKNEKDEEVKNKFNHFIYYAIRTEKEKFLPLLNNPLIIENIIHTDQYSNNALVELVTHSKLLEELINNVQEDEKYKLFNQEKYTRSHLLSLILNQSNNNIYMDESLLTYILENIEKYVSDEEDNNKEVLISGIIINKTKKINNPFFNDKVFEKYTKTIVKALSADSKEDSNFKYQERLIEFKKLEKVLNTSIYNKIKTKLQVVQKDVLYKLIQNFKENNGGVNFKERLILENIVKYVNLTGDIKVLDILNANPLNPDWKNIIFYDRDSKKYNQEENIFTYLLKKIEKKEVEISLIEWLIEESIQNFNEIKINNKDIFTYYSKEGMKKNKEGMLLKVVDKILENEVFFNTLLSKNKSKLKLIQTMNNESVQKKLSYYLLDKKLDKNEKEIKHKSNKI